MRTASTAIFAFLLAILPCAAMAEGPRPAPPTVRLTIAGAEGAEAETLRVAVEAELGRPVVLVREGEAPAGGDELTVDVRGADLVVRFRAGAVERKVRLEPSGDARVKQVALVAGNVARDESADLLGPLRALRKVSPPEVTPAPSVTKPSPASGEDDAVTEYRRLEATLRYYDEAERASSLAGGIAALAVGGVSIPTGLYVRNHLDEELAGNIAIGVGVGAAVSGVGQLVGAFRQSGVLYTHRAHLTGSYGRVPTRELVANVEREWGEQAATERSVRRWVTGIGAGVGLTGLTVATSLILTASPSVKDEGRGAAGVILLSLSGVLLVSSVHGFLTPSASEQYYEGYRRASGRVSLSPTVAPLQGGGMVGLVGRF
jgi:hypothetical protein